VCVVLDRCALTLHAITVLYSASSQRHADAIIRVNATFAGFKSTPMYVRSRSSAHWSCKID